MPLLLGLAITFAAAASLAAVAGGWAIEVSHHGRTVALAAMTLFGLALLLPRLAAAMSRPAICLGVRLSTMAGQRASATTSLLLGIATGLVWATCAGPVLGLILTAAALRGPGLGTSLLLLAYGGGAATALAAGVLLRGRLLAMAKRSIGWGDRIRRVIGVGVTAGAVTSLLGVDAGLLSRWSAAPFTQWEQTLLDVLPKEPALIIPSAQAAPAVAEPLASLLTTRQWLNTPPLQADDIAGKVVVVNFWTYSCINCLRVLPYVKAWGHRYAERGLVVVGVHTPEFAFEKDASNVRKALPMLGITYPIAVDNDFGIWRMFGNQAWPGLYFWLFAVWCGW